MNPNASKHELKEGCDDQDVTDGADGHEHTLNHVLERNRSYHVEHKPHFGQKTD